MLQGKPLKADQRLWVFQANQNEANHIQSGFPLPFEKTHTTLLWQKDPTKQEETRRRKELLAPAHLIWQLQVQEGGEAEVGPIKCYTPANGCTPQTL